MGDAGSGPGPAQYLEALAAERPRLETALGRLEPAAPVPGCPGWSVRDLVCHLGSVHRWATEIVAVPHTAPVVRGSGPPTGGWPVDRHLGAWLTEGLDGLIGALGEASDALSCWTFLPARSPRAMWARRQTHETIVHRVDLELAAGAAPTPVAADLAADGIDELLCGFGTRRRPSARTAGTAAVRVSVSDDACEWRVRVAGGLLAPLGAHEPIDGEVAGPAFSVYLALWGREPARWRAPEDERALLDLLAATVRA